MGAPPFRVRASGWAGVSPKEYPPRMGQQEALPPGGPVEVQSAGKNQGRISRLCSHKPRLGLLGPGAVLSPIWL